MDGAPAAPYALIINGVAHGFLDAGDPPRYWRDGAEPYRLRRWRNDTGWQGPEYAYEVHGDQGLVIRGWVSQHDGIGVEVPGASWGFRQLSDGTTVLGDRITIVIDHAARRVMMTTPDGAADLPGLLCAGMMLLDPA